MRIIFYDTTAGGLSTVWRNGATLYQALGQVDVVVPVDCWEDVLEFLKQLAPGTVKEIQFWGHGRVADPLMGSASISSYLADFNSLRSRLAVNCIVWFRCCNAFTGAHGKRFAEQAAAAFNRRVAAHTYIIGNGVGFQSGLQVLYPGTEPRWSDREGLTPDGEKKTSGMFEPNTVHALTFHVPAKYL